MNRTRAEIQADAIAFNRETAAQVLALTADPRNLYASTFSTEELAVACNDRNQFIHGHDVHGPVELGNGRWLVACDLTAAIERAEADITRR